MSNEQVIGRLQCINPTSEDAKGSLSNRDLLIDDTPAITVGQIEMKCREFEKNSSRKLDMVIIDYLKLMYCENPNKHPRLSDLAESSAAG